MAWPLVAALALAAGSAYANNRAASAQEEARKNAQRAQMRRQMTLQGEADEINQQTQERFQRDNYEDQMQELVDQENAHTEAAIEEGGEEFSPTEALDDDTPAVIRESGEKAKAKSLAEALRNARSLNALQGYGLAGFENDLALGKAATGLSQIGNFAQGNQNIFRAELEDAQNAGGSWSNLGQILGAASMMVGGYGALAGGAAGAAAGAGSSAAGAAGSAPVAYGSGFGALANTGTYGGALGSAAAGASAANTGTSLASLFQNGYSSLQPLLSMNQNRR